MDNRLTTASAINTLTDAMIRLRKEGLTDLAEDVQKQIETLLAQM